MTSRRTLRQAVLSAVLCAGLFAGLSILDPPAAVAEEPSAERSLEQREPTAADDRLKDLMSRAGELSEAEIQELLDAMPPQEVQVNLVMIPTVVTNRRGKPITGLERDDFRISERGRPRQIAWFNEDQDRPARIALLIDRSGSMDQSWIADRTLHALTPLTRMLRTDRDKMMLISFAGDDIVIERDWTSRPLTVVGQAMRIPRGGDTALTDALLASADLVPPRPEERQAIVLVSDGLDNASKTTSDDVIRAARSVGVPVYVLAVTTVGGEIREKRDAASPLRALRHVAHETGGRFFAITDKRDGEAAAKAIIADLRHQYVLAFHPEEQRDGTFRPLKVWVHRRGATVRARTGYQ